MNLPRKAVQPVGGPGSDRGLTTDGIHHGRYCGQTSGGSLVRVSDSREMDSERNPLERGGEFQVITCYLRYVIDPDKLDDFEIYAKKWMPLVNKFGGKHHGYFLPHEGANNIAFALFSFPSLAAYEEYRTKAATDPECKEAMAHYRNTKCFDSYERSFMRPVFD